jgi:hypothetical protein
MSRFAYLFNSYYEALGPRHAAALSAALLTRPSLDEVLAYRRHVDAAMRTLHRKPRRARPGPPPRRWWNWG